MATIRNSITMVDRMTPVFRSSIKAMNDTLRVMRQVDAQLNKGSQSKAFNTAQKSITQANNALLRFQNNIDKTNNSMSRLGDASGNVSRNMKGLSGSGFNLVNLASALYLLKGIGNVITSISSAPDEAMSTKARLGLFNESKYTEDELYSQVYQTALSTRTGLEETGNLATRILISGAMTGENSAVGALKVTDIINRSLVAGGGTSEENRRSLLQLSQALASGTLQGDELRAIREQTPYLAKVLTEGLGKVDEKFIGTTIGDLKELGRSGELTSDVIIRSFLAMEDEVSEAFEKMPKTFGQATTQLGTIWDYFLYLLSQTGGPLNKINRAMWELVEYLTSAEGQEFMNSLATGFSLVVDIVLGAITLIAQFMEFLGQNADIATSLLWGLAGVLAVTAAQAIVTWISIAWPILLVALAIGLVVYAMLQFGITSSQILGGVIGGLFFLGTLIYDIAVLIGVVLATVILGTWNIIVDVATLAILIIQSIVQTILFAVGGIANIFIGLGATLTIIFNGMYVAIATVIEVVYASFVALAVGVLEVLKWIASGIDAVFGGNLADTIGGWQTGLGDSIEALHEELGIEDAIKEMENAYKDAPWVTFERDGEWNIMDNMDDVINGADKFKVDQDWAINGMLSENLLKNPLDSWDSGFATGESIGNMFEGFSPSGIMDEYSNLFDNMGPIETVVNGGTIDAIGSDVSISEDDIELLRDISAKEFLLNLTAVTPQAHVTFGDVRETADVNAILGVIEDMVENSMATSLIQ